MNEISSSSFEFYEGLRALVPGGLVVGIYASISKTFGITSLAVSGSALVAVAATLAIGLVLLFLDIPGKAAVYHYDTPVEHLTTWGDVAPRGGAAYKTIYFEILDVEVPPGIKTKVYYFGAIYKIAFEIIYLAAASVPVLALAVIFPTVGVTRHGDERQMRALFIGACALHLCIVALALRQRRGKIGADLGVEIPNIDRALLVVGAIGAAVYLVWHLRWAGVVGVALPSLIWAGRYFRGVKLASGVKRNLHASTAAVTYGIASVSACAIGVRGVSDSSSLDAQTVLGWLAASLVGAALITARDHEKKLLGVYTTQRVWLDGKRETLVDKGYFIEKTA
jgi:hypothetical protein